MKLIYAGAGTPSVFDSQVLGYINYISKSEIYSELILFWGVRNEYEKSWVLSKRCEKNVRIIFFKTLPNYLGFNFAQRLFIYWHLRKFLFAKNDYIIHTRGELVAFHLIKIFQFTGWKLRLLTDIRGINEEIKEFGSQKWPFGLLKIWNYQRSLKIVKTNYFTSVVSSSLKEYLLEKYGFDSHTISVNPCLATEKFIFNETARDKLRKKMRLSNNDILIVFSSGGDAPWQNNEVIKELADHDIKILNLSRKQINEENVINAFVSFEEMPKYLSAADIGFIWRNPSVVNRVASPVKFSEYVCCGLPILTNYNVNLIADYVRWNEGSGLCIDGLSKINLIELQHLKSQNRFKLASIGIAGFGIEEIANKYQQLYKSVMEYHAIN